MGAYVYKLTSKTITAQGPEGPVVIGLIRYAFKPWGYTFDGEKMNRKLEFATGVCSARAYWRIRNRPTLCAYEKSPGVPDIIDGKTHVYSCRGAAMFDDCLHFMGMLTPDGKGGYIYTPKTPKAAAA